MICVNEYLIRAKEKWPRKVALQDGKESISYLQLYRYAVTLAGLIKKKVSGKSNAIMVITDRSVWSVVAFWGVIMSGNFYFSVDVHSPKDRIESIISISTPKIVVNTTDQDLEFDLEKIDKHQFTINEELVSCLPERVIDTDPLYMVFTSGSTGMPKAVIKSHRSVLSFVESFMSTFDISESDVFGNQASFDFDVSAKDIFLSVYIGGTMCIIPNICFTVPSMLAGFLEKNRVTVLVWSAAAVKYVTRVDCFRDLIPCRIRKVFFSGESMAVQSLKYWRNKLPEATFVNMYAPSEVTGNCLYHIVNESDWDSDGILPLTDVFPNVDVMVISGNRLANDKERGELYVRGAFLSSGYYNNIKDMKRVFIQNPLINSYADIVYKTGDYVLKEGEKLFFLGRKDNQVKHMGHRIEIEEIEVMLKKTLKTDELCVIYDKEKMSIILILKGNEYSYDDVITLAKKSLPKYMLPGYLFSVDGIPYNSRGKLDRKKAMDIYIKRRG